MTEAEEIESIKPEYQNDPLEDLFYDILGMQQGDMWDGMSGHKHRIRTAAATQVFISRLKALQETKIIA